jgi:hypothetical protein
MFFFFFWQICAQTHMAELSEHVHLLQLYIILHDTQTETNSTKIQSRHWAWLYIGNPIYWTFKQLITANNFISRCLVTVSNCRRSPSSGFPNRPRPQLPTSHFSQLQLSTELVTVTVTLRLRFTAKQFVLVGRPLKLTTSIFLLNSCSDIPYVTSSVRRGWVCYLQLLLTLVGAVSLRSESRGTHDHFYCLRFDTPSTWRARSPHLYLAGTVCPSYTPRHWVPFS